MEIFLKELLKMDINKTIEIEAKNLIKTLEDYKLVINFIMKIKWILS